MRRVLVSVSLVIAAVSAGVRVYDVSTDKDYNGSATTVSQSFALTCDSLLWTEVFLGNEAPYEWYHFEIRDSATWHVVAQADGQTPDNFPGYAGTFKSEVHQTEQLSLAVS